MIAETLVISSKSYSGQSLVIWGNRSMRYFSGLVGAIAALALLAPVTANAFQQERVGGATNTEATTQVAPSDDDKTLQELTGSNLAGQALPKQKQGTELSIPGLGTVGVIPRMDFGLELLYGEKADVQESPQPEADSDGLRIRGSIKHRF